MKEQLLCSVVLFCSVKNTINNGDCSVRFFLLFYSLIDIFVYTCIYVFAAVIIVKNTCLVGFVLLDLQFYVYVLQIVICPFVFCNFFFAIVLSVLLRYADSDYPFGIFKLFFKALSNYSYFIQMYYLFCNIRFLIAAVITIEEHVYQILGHCDI